jgi:DNA (cytosine-5)-methyltransferase 1
LTGQLTLFAADTHASPFPPPGSDKARMMTATSGQNLQGSWMNSGPLGSLERTLLATSAWVSMTCWLTWKPKATPAGRLLFQLAPSAHRTGETGSGLWGTPLTTRGWPTDPDRQKSDLRWQVREWAKQQMWPTPSASDDRDRGNLSSGAIKRRKEKGKQIMLSQSVSDQSGALNPVWVEWLMGFPSDWTNLESE